MLKSLLVFLTLGSTWGLTAQEQPPNFTDEQLRRGVIIYPNRGLPAEDPMIHVKKYQGLRVSDVVDGLQAVGLQDRGLMDKSIRPLWRDNSENARHRFYGVALTVQYFPTNKPAAGKMPYEEFKKWHSHWYSTYAPEIFKTIIRPGHALVIDGQGIDFNGFVGSMNALNWTSMGMTGVVTSGTARDVDEIILQQVPVYVRSIGGSTRPGHTETGAVNTPIVVGGVLVRPGDFVVADGDGVVVVPREYIDDVAKAAWDVAKGDKDARRKLYEKTSRTLDSTVK
jgi:regulator of RNase E activity RraA